MDKVKSSLCAVLKEVFVRPIEGYSQSISELPAPFTTGLVINLWMGADFKYRANELLTQIENSDIYPNNISEEDFRNGLKSTLKNLHGQMAFRKTSMFDALKREELEDSCNKILALLSKYILAESRDVNLVYFVNSIIGNSFSIPSQGIHLVKKEDRDYLDKLQVITSYLSQIDIDAGHIKESHTSEKKLDFNFAIIIEGKNSFNDSISFGESKLRNLSSVIHAIYVNNHGHRPAICSGEQHSILFQLFANYSGREDYGSSTIPYTFPAYCRDLINLDNDYQTSILKFFERSEGLSQARKNKMNVCLYHYNLGIHMQKNTDIAFIHYSIAFDALYGTAKGNQKSIVNGILSLALEGIDGGRATKLYKLRCSLVHGGVSTIKSWNNYKSYIKKYQSEPFHDLQKILAFAITNWSKN